MLWKEKLLIHIVNGSIFKQNELITRRVIKKVKLTKISLSINGKKVLVTRIKRTLIID